MHLTITNTGPQAEAIGDPDGGFVDAINPGVDYEVNNDSGVLIVGDKPSVREQFEQAAATITTAVRQLITAILGRKDVADQAGHMERVSLAIMNHGPHPVRVILGDGVNDMTVESGASKAAQADGYVELRELGTLDDSQLDGGRQPGTGNE